MRKVLLTTLLATVSFIVGAQSFSSNADIKHHSLNQVDAYPVNGFVEHLPPDYYSNPTKKYPMIVMLHGQGERGNGTSQLWTVVRAGPSREVETSGKFCIDGECFIVVTPQLYTGGWSAAAQAKFWDYLLNKRGLRYDPERIYLTGLSLGANGVWNWVTSDYPGSDKIAAIAPMAGWGSTNQAYKLSQRGTSSWGFHGTADPVISYSAGKAMHDAARNASNPTGAEHRWQGFEGQGHNIWWATYRMDEYYVKPNVYRWMASKRLSGATSSPPPSSTNQAPTVSAGPDITLPASQGSVLLEATASDPDGSIASYQWTKVSGPAVSMGAQDRSFLGLSNFDPNGGVYEFQVKVTDNKGATATDRVRVTKEVVDGGGSSTTGNKAPTVSAGPDVTVPYNEGSALLQATASDSDGSIASYKWTKISGPSVKLGATDRSFLGLSYFAESGGTYEFQVTVTDNKGATAYDRVKVVKEVNGSSTGSTNKAPNVSAGSDIVVPYNEGSAMLQATANDTDGTIVSYLWKKISGPSVSMGASDRDFLGLSNFAASGGVYEFEVTVTDNDGAKASDRVIVTKEVNSTGGGSNNPPVVSAGSDITVPYNVGSVLLNATASDSDGSISSYQWVKISGPSVKMGATDRNFLGLSEFSSSGGVYEFQVTVTDNDGAKASDRIVVTKEVVPGGSSGSTSGITVSAGPDLTVDMFTGSVWVNGSASDNNGSIVSYKWTKVKGPSVTMGRTGSPSMALHTFSETGGIYEFKLTVTDNDGNTASDNVLVYKYTVMSGNNISTAGGRQGTSEFGDDIPQVEVKNYRTDGDPIQMPTSAPHRIVVMGINGVTITDETINGTLDANMLNNGMYIYNLVTEDGQIVQKGRIIKY